MIDQRANWAFYLGDTSIQGVGVGAMVEFCLIEHVFSNLDLNKLCCEVLSFNTSVLKLHNKFGFKREGLLVQHRCKNKELYDVHILALFKDTWLSKRDIIYKKLMRVGSKNVNNRDR